MNRVIKKVGSLFTGIGGFDLGFERAGFETAWQVEIEPFCNKILARHFPNAKRYTDITKIDTNELEKVDVITGGFPCQDLSIAGKRAGLSGERSGLFYELKRIVQALRPTWIVVENVPGLLSSHGGKDFGLVLFHLEKCGYGLSWRILDSRYFGVAQRRRRVFIVGYLGKECPPEILFERESVCGDSTEKCKTRSQIAKGIRGRPESYGEIQPTLQAAFGHHGWSIGDQDIKQLVAFDAYNNSATKESASLGQNCGMSTGRNLVAPTLGASGAGTERTASAGNEAQFCIPAVAPTTSLRLGHTKGNERQGGIREEFIGAIEATGSSSFAIGTPANPNGVRTTTRVPGRMDTPDGPRYRALGNAVTVNVAFWIAKRIMEYERRLAQENLKL